MMAIGMIGRKSERMLEQVDEESMGIHLSSRTSPNGRQTESLPRPINSSWKVGMEQGL